MKNLRHPIWPAEIGWGGDKNHRPRHEVKGGCAFLTGDTPHLRSRKQKGPPGFRLIAPPFHPSCSVIGFLLLGRYDSSNSEVRPAP